MWESCSSTKASFQNLISDFKAEVFEKDDSEIPDMSKKEAFLPLLVHQSSNSKIEIKFKGIYKRKVYFKYQAIFWQLDGNTMKQVELKKYKFEHRSRSRLKALSGNSGSSSFPKGVQL